MPFELDDIKNDRCFKDFIRSRSRRSSTKSQYITRIRVYANFVGKIPTELIEEAENEEEAGIKLRNRKINDYFYDFREKLEEEGMLPSTINGYFDTVKAFYRHYDIHLPKLKINLNSGENWSMEDIPTIDHVREAVKVSDIRDKAILLLMLSSGMGSGEIRHLTYENFIKSVSDYIDLSDPDKLNIPKVVYELRKIEDLIGTWKIHRYKTGMPYITFNSPESTQAIIDYLSHRENNNKEIKNLDDPLFVSSRRIQISSQGLVFVFRRINERAGFGRSKERNRRFFTSHTMRKLFTSTLYNKGIDQLAVDWMLGHKINPVTEAYFKNDPQTLKAKYMEAVENLTLEKVKVKNVTTQEYDLLIRDSKDKDGKITSLEGRIENLEAMLKKTLEKQIEREKGERK
ncbi:integrase family protein [Methanobacterium formicicum DSM 3637]|uniref:Integrase family protein n=1 Tax=Methanobacterium formicicum (strain DSM 3637 / PP1) TaxID=1204725 RepID=K2R6R2_METFP|nr:integrase family protein [Methanobacterium formicicum DSM 3637]